jgi:hypothetical protein
LSHPVALSREGILPSTGNWTAAGCVVARKSWLALLRNVVHSLVSWSIGRSFKAGAEQVDQYDESLSTQTSSRSTPSSRWMARSDCT